MIRPYENMTGIFEQNDEKVKKNLLNIPFYDLHLIVESFIIGDITKDGMEEAGYAKKKSGSCGGVGYFCG